MRGNQTSGLVAGFQDPSRERGCTAASRARAHPALPSPRLPGLPTISRIPAHPSKTTSPLPLPLSLLCLIMSADGKLFDDLFTVTTLDKGGKKFDRGQPKQDLTLNSSSTQTEMALSRARPDDSILTSLNPSPDFFCVLQCPGLRRPRPRCP